MGPCMREVRTWEQKKHSHKQLAMVISQHKWIVPHTTTCHPPSSYLRLKYQFTPKSSISLSKHEMNLCYCARTLSFSSKPQGPAAAVRVVGAGNARAVTPPGPELLAPHPAKKPPAGCAATSAASRLREVLACAGATSFWVAGPTGPISTTPHRPLTGALPLGHVFVEATVYDEGA